MWLIVLIILILLMYGGGYRYPTYRPHGIGLGTILLIVLVVLLLTGRI